MRERVIDLKAVAAGPAITRDLMLLSKVLQTVANGVFFSSKEEYLLELNDFVTEHQNSVLQFLDQLSEVRFPLLS